MRELNGKDALRAALEHTRQYTLSLYAHLTPAQMQVPYLRIVNPPLWEMAHIAWFQEFWCLRYREGEDPLPARLQNADPMLNSAIIEHTRRWNLAVLTNDVVARYMARVFADTLEALEKASEAQLYFFKLALLHEDMHGEAMLMTLQTLGLPAPKWHRAALSRPAPEPVASEVSFAGGEFQIGSVAGADFTFDNELPAHPVKVGAFSLAASATSNSHFRNFVEANGYERREFWSEDGWRWKLDNAVTAPRYWRKHNGTWLERRFDAWEPLDPDSPVTHVNAYEAEAYCRFSDRRLPTEPEWEFAARSGNRNGSDRFPWGDKPAQAGKVSLDGTFERPVPTAALSSSDSALGLRQLLGNVWEWTATPFLPYPGFVAGPYQEYSQPWFETHRSLRGGCFATRSHLVHNRWRNFYTPERNDIFAGFRTAGNID